MKHWESMRRQVQEMEETLEVRDFNICVLQLRIQWITVDSELIKFNG